MGVDKKVMAASAVALYGLGKKAKLTIYICYLIMSDAPQYGWEAPRNVL
jgi:hypothetical protein